MQAADRYRSTEEHTKPGRGVVGPWQLLGRGLMVSEGSSSGVPCNGALELGRCVVAACQQEEGLLTYRYGGLVLLQRQEVTYAHLLCPFLETALWNAIVTRQLHRYTRKCIQRSFPAELSSSPDCACFMQLVTGCNQHGIHGPAT